MSFLTWMVLGLVAGFIGSKIVNKAGEGILIDIVLGIVGAVAGGWIFSIVGYYLGAETPTSQEKRDQ